ncbi:uncharacterized protein LOC101745853 [Anopheles sinensis]|uniref:Uncharacterized protein LOC101745853 n=1 Tax=Anopheles sinensis TaxID=74873 RepID=A0A084W0Q3_ANOSI|nr:uncharacterized protein LOC101745853 [Anopheles sinensis]
MDGSPEVERAETGATVHAVRMDSSEPEKQVRKPCGIPAASASSDIEQKDAGSSQASDIAQRATGGERRHCEWPKSPAIAENPADQIRATVLVHAEWTPIMDFTHFSRWEYVIRSMAYVKRFLHNARPGRLRHDGAFSQDELKEAEIEVLKLVQKEAFPEEVATLQTETPVIEKTSHIMMYTPMYG